MSQFLQPDFTKGDPNTLGGYMAVHARPAAFEGSDGFSYSVDVLADADGASWGAYLVFVKWARIGASAPEGHLETDILARAASEDEAVAQVKSLQLNQVKQHLDALISRAAPGTPKRKWWDAMNADEPGDDHQ